MNKEKKTNSREQITKKKGQRAKSKLVLLFSLLITLSSLLIISCSSAPKKPTEIFSERIIAANQLNLANQTANQGRYEDALLIIGEARRLALGTDDPSLRIKTTMGRANILFALGRHAEAFKEWEIAADEGDVSEEPVLAALARIYTIRGELVLLANETEMSDHSARAAAERCKTRVTGEMLNVKSDSLSTATGYVTLGMAEKQLRSWVEAENAVKRALEIHEKNRCLEDAAYDWFLIASIRSLAGNYTTALEALRMAISFDRRAENGFGLASSWQAMGDVYKKSGQIEESGKAYRRALDIYRAINLSAKAEELEQLL